MCGHLGKVKNMCSKEWCIADSYNKRSLYTMFFVVWSLWSSEYNTTMFCLILILDRAVYSWPWANTSVCKSRMVLSRVNPWHPLKVDAYASRNGNCKWWTVQEAHRGVNSNHIWGMQWMLPSSPVKLLIMQTSMYLRCKHSIITLAFLTNPFSTDMFLIIEQMQPCLSLSSCGGTPFCVKIAK